MHPPPLKGITKRRIIKELEIASVPFEIEISLGQPIIHNNIKKINS